MILNLKLPKTRKHGYLFLSFDLIRSLRGSCKRYRDNHKIFYAQRGPDTHAAMHHGTVYEHFVQIDGKVSVLIYIG